MKRILFSILTLILLDSCSDQTPATDHQETENSSAHQFEDLYPFSGSYYFAEKDDASGNIILTENCWTKGLDQFELVEFSGSPGEYYFAFHGHHSTMYLLENIEELDENTLIIGGKLEDESSDEYFEFTLTNNHDKTWLLEGDDMDILLVKADDKEQFEYIPCADEEAFSDLDYMNAIFKALFALQEGGETLAHYIPEGGIHLSIPGPGVAPEESDLLSDDEVVATELFNTPAYNRLMEYVQMHNDEERGFLEFVDELPDRCMPGKEALFVKTSPYENKHEVIRATAMLTKMNDELNEVYTYVILELEYNGRMFIKSIDARDCGA
ncbi:MAG: hypothetical protein KDD41_00165 [Flavobacteriales bacterium]|nr:hypothetical protein [Flavobacteriales bacterium]